MPESPEYAVAISNIPIAIKRIQQNVTIFDGAFPSYGNGETHYNLTPNQNWLASFWAGLLWLTYAVTQDSSDCLAAENLLPSFAKRLDDGIRLNHDLGFLFTLSARAQYQLAEDKAALDLAIRAADVLIARFQPVGAYIQAWGDLDDPEQAGRFIIDCMMNLPFLFWISDKTGDDRYADVARAHARTSQRYLLRPDGSSYHTYYLNPATGDPLGPKTHQGYADESLWARGQAWAIFGFSVVAAWWDDDDMLASAKAAADCYLKHAPLTSITPWDLALPDEGPHYPDSSADAIAANGLLRLAALTGDNEYRSKAIQLLEMLSQQAFDQRSDAQGLLNHGTQHAPHNYGIDTYVIYGDYFYLEALLQLTKQAPEFWGPVNAQ